MQREKQPARPVVTCRLYCSSLQCSLQTWRAVRVLCCTSRENSCITSPGVSYPHCTLTSSLCSQSIFRKRKIFPYLTWTAWRCQRASWTLCGRSTVPTPSTVVTAARWSEPSGRQQEETPRCSNCQKRYEDTANSLQMLKGYLASRGSPDGQEDGAGAGAARGAVGLGAGEAGLEPEPGEERGGRLPAAAVRLPSCQVTTLQ